MRTAILSDIHGNIEALEKVLEDLDQQGVDETICLGDTIGYGPDPDACIRAVRDRAIPSVLGNHEYAVVEKHQRRWFNPLARKALSLTEELLSRDSHAYIKSLPMNLYRGAALYVHGVPPDSVRTYLFELTDETILERCRAMDASICFVGHTHELEYIAIRQGKVVRLGLAEGILALPETDYELVNVGSVGQPRDGDNRAKYVIWDQERSTLELRCVPYDIAATAMKILALGFPEHYARRLW